jgi:organic radical activating enzyme
MDEMKRFFDCRVPVTTCNLRCHYCYITLNGMFKNKLPEFKYPAEIIGKALSQERIGGACHFNFCGNGETLLPPEMTPILKAILEQGHYIMVVTNGTVVKRFDEILQFPKELLNRLGFKFSFHFLELKRLNIIDKWFGTIKKVKAAGCSISVELTPSDECVSYIDEIKKLCLDNLGAFCHITVARDSTKRKLPILTYLPMNEYRQIWGSFKSPMFDFKLSTFNIKRKEFCYAGLWSGYIDIGTGEMTQCYGPTYSQNIFENINKPINFIPVGHNCLQPHCFNSHAWLTLGLIPELKTPKYSDIRNRICRDGTSWLTEEMNAFLAQKLYDNNELLSHDKQKNIDVNWKKKKVINILNWLKYKFLISKR